MNSMNPLIAVGFVAFFISALVVGVRLLLLWRQTRQLPELLIGLGVLGIGPVGFGLQAVATGLFVAGMGGEWIYLAGTTAASVGVIAKLEFNHRVYHSDGGPWRLLARAMSALLLTLILYRLLLPDLTPTPGTNDGAAILRSALQAFGLLWGCAEALNFWWRMRKRQILGLASRVVTQRFLLWGVGAGAAGLGTGIGQLASVITGVPVLQIPWVVALSSGMGFVAAMAMWLAFMPPAAYLRWVRAGTDATAEGAQHA